MSSITTSSPGLGRRSLFSRYKWLGFFLLLFLVLLVAMYFVLTSSPVLRALVLPRVAAALGAGVTADHLALSPLSSLRIQNLGIATGGAIPVLRVQEVYVRYDLWSIVRGRYVVPEVRLVHPVVYVEQSDDGTSNLDSVLKALGRRESEPSAEVPEFRLGSLALRGGALSFCLRDAAGPRQCSVITNLDVELSNLGNGSEARLTLAARATQSNRGTSNGTDTVTMDIKTELTLGLDSRLLPTGLKGTLGTDVREATGSLGAAAGIAGRLAVDLGPDELRDLTLRFQRGETALGEVRVYGPLSLGKQEGRLTFQIKPVGHAALALVGAPLGMDFGETVVGGSGFIDIAGRATRYTANITLEARQFSVRTLAGATPPLDLQFEFRGNFDLDAQVGYLERLNLSGRLPDRELFSIVTQRALNLAWNRDEPRTAAPALIGLSVNDLRLTDWRSILGTNVLDGVVNLDAQATSDKDGRNMAVSFATFPGFSSTSFKDPVPFIAQLLEPNDPLSRHIRDGLSPSLRVGYANYLAARNPQTQYEALRPMVQTLSHEMNRVLERGPLYDPARFENITLRPVTSRLLAGAPTGENLQRLNRLLLEDAYARHIARSVQIYDLAVAGGGIVQSNLDVVVSGTVNLTDFNLLSLDRMQASFREEGIPLFGLRASTTYSLKDGMGNVEVSLTGDLPTVLARHPVPEVAVSRGDFHVTTLLNWNRSQYSGNIQAIAGDVSGVFGGYRIENYSAQFDLGCELQAERFTLRRLGLTAREGTRSSGTAEIIGALNSEVQTAQFTLNVSGLNQFALRPFLPPSFGSLDLAGININARGEMRYDARTRPRAAPGTPEAFQELVDSLVAGRGNTSLELTTGVTNIVLRHRPSGRTSQPLGLDLQMAGNREGDVYAFPENTLQFSPTPQAQNLLRWSGRLDLSPTNATPGSLDIRSDAIDLGALVDMYVTFSSATNAVAASPAPAAGAGAPETEPPAVRLPIRQFTGALSISNIFARDITARDCVVRAVLDADRFTLEPCAIRINDTPVAASLKLDLTRPGYVYETTFNADGLKLRPFVNTLAPRYLDQIRGDLFARWTLAGAGVTGPSLQKNLRGEASLNATNLTFHIVTPRTQKLLRAIATALRVEDLARSPLTLIAANLQIADGTVAVQPFQAASDAFFAEASGAIRLAPVTTNSTIDLPVQLALRQDLARQLKVPGQTVAGRTNYLALPPFVRVAGTVGSPETDIDKLKLASILAGSVGGALGGTAGQAIQGVGNLLQGDTQGAVGALGSLLQGAKPAATNAPAVRSTNAPVTPPPGTNAAPSAARTNSNSVLPGVINLIDALQKRN